MEICEKCLNDYNKTKVKVYRYNDIELPKYLRSLAVKKLREIKVC